MFATYLNGLEMLLKMGFIVLDVLASGEGELGGHDAGVVVC
jgi:hypothetical protein